jgi:hypothetical protein
MIASVVYWMFRRLVELLVLRRRSEDRNAVEILVLRHELAVLRRQVARPRCTLADRVVLSALAQVLPRDRWGRLFVRPETIRRWHRELVARRWTYRRATTGRPPTCAFVRDLVLRSRERIRRGATGESMASSRVSRSRSRRARSGRSSNRPALSRRLAARRRAGVHSYARRPPGSSPATS